MIPPSKSAGNDSSFDGIASVSDGGLEQESKRDGPVARRDSGFMHSWCRHHQRPAQLRGVGSIACEPNRIGSSESTSSNNMFKTISIRVRLALAMSFLGVLLIIGGAMGIAGVSMSNDDVKKLYAGRLASSEALAQANIALSRARLRLYRVALDPTSPQVPEEARAARNLLNASQRALDTYRALPFSGPDEERRATEANTKFDAFVTSGLEPMFNAIATRDATRIVDVWLRLPPSLFFEVSGRMDSLGNIQVNAARATFDSAQIRFHWFVGIAIAGALTAVAAAVFAWWSLQRAIGAPLEQALRHFRAIADGDLTTHVEVQTDDEMGQLMAGLQMMQRKLAQALVSCRTAAGQLIPSPMRSRPATSIYLNERRSRPRRWRRLPRQWRNWRRGFVRMPTTPTRSTRSSPAQRFSLSRAMRLRRKRYRPCVRCLIHPARSLRLPT
ncbi:HAMP domain-containing protein [Paraburkholderia panacisoli]|uniref:HAMP domain-containing protein n=1 Tax=Paraburkholderia panacisoli TaxID=2603818 RepID=A0A5B0G7G1_9BURK|nr:HAMP domain-containing protein [Paraburkholderia panacisoli]